MQEVLKGLYRPTHQQMNDRPNFVTPVLIHMKMLLALLRAQVWLLETGRVVIKGEDLLIV